MRELIYKLKCWWRLKTDKCEHCGLRLRKSYNSYYGGIDVPKSIGGRDMETYYVCNLCFKHLK